MIILFLSYFSISFIGILATVTLVKAGMISDDNGGTAVICCLFWPMTILAIVFGYLIWNPLDYVTTQIAKIIK